MGKITFSCKNGNLRCPRKLSGLHDGNQMLQTDDTENNRMVLTRQALRDGQSRSESWTDWARELMEVEGVSQKDLARSWKVSESSVSRWLAGLQATDLSLPRAAAFSRLVHRPIQEIAARMGHAGWLGEGVPRVQPKPEHPPVPTVRLEPAAREGSFYLLLHLELPASNVAAIIATLDAPQREEVSKQI